MPGDIPLEVAVFSGCDAISAQNLGARRVELNAPGSYGVGGLTPPVEELTSIAAELRVPIRIMIRPVAAPLTPGVSDFMYSDADFGAMKRSIEEFKCLGIMNPLRGDGFVFGIVRLASDKDNKDKRDRHGQGDGEDEEGDDGGTGGITVDVDRCRELTQIARPFPCVFHRAFDPIAATSRLDQGLADLIRSNFEGLLTAGGHGSHADNLATIGQMVRHVAGQLQIVAGGGLRSHNAAAAAAALGVHKKGSVWLHSACLTSQPERPPEAVDPDELLALLGRLAATSPD
jgi:copper homeostasis protein